LLTAAAVAAVVALLSAGARLAAAQTAPGADSGVFVIRSNGTNIVTERFQIRQTNAGWEASGELQLQAPGRPRVSETSTLRMDRDWKPARYERRQQAPQKGSLTAQFTPDGTLLTASTDAGSQEQIFLLPENSLVVLDTNFFHHFALLLRQFDAARGGTQAFNVFVPQEATPSIIRLISVGRETLAVTGTPGAPMELLHFRATTEDIQIEIWTTDQRAIQRIEIPQANLEISRQP
jgi:hypothetical protein